MLLYPSKEITIGTNSIYYLDSGDTEKLGISTPVIVMLSGWPVSCHTFDDIIKIVSDKFRCIAVDLPGWGNSTDNDKVFHGIEYNVEFLHSFINKIIPGRDFSIFGYSVGGNIGIVYARRHPNVVSLVLFSPPLDGIEHMKERFARSPKTCILYYTLRCFPFLLYLLEISRVRNIFAKHMLRGFVYKSALKKISEKQQSRIDAVFKNSFNLSPKALFDIAIDTKRDNLVPLLKKIGCKTLFLACSHDTAVPPKNTILYSKSCRNASVCIFDNYDHFLILENPSLLSEALEKFLSH